MGSRLVESSCYTGAEKRLYIALKSGAFMKNWTYWFGRNPKVTGTSHRFEFRVRSETDRQSSQKDAIRLELKEGPGR